MPAGRHRETGRPGDGATRSVLVAVRRLPLALRADAGDDAQRGQGDPETAAWAQKLFGTVRQIETSETKNSGWNSSTSHQLHERPLLLASHFLALPFPRLDGDYQAVADVPCRDRTFLIRRPFAEVLARCVPPADVPALVRFGTPADQLLAPWTPEEQRQFLGHAQPSRKGRRAAPAAGGAKGPLPWKFD